MTSLYLASPLRRLAPAATAAVPILMYHSIAGEDESHVHPYFRVATPPAIFAAQMRHLHEAGYTTCTPEEISAGIRSGQMAAGKRVAITFDDGYQNIYREALPVLHQFGFTAIVYLPTSFIADAAQRFKDRNCLSWAEVRELQKHGISIGSHTVSHPQLSRLSREQIRQELVESKQTIEDKLSAPVRSFAYPFAFPQQDRAFQVIFRQLLKESGYQSGVCTIVGRASLQSDPLFLPRLPLNGDDDPELLQAKLTGGYDWVGAAQRASKKIKSMIAPSSQAAAAWSRS